MNGSRRALMVLPPDLEHWETRCFTTTHGHSATGPAPLVRASTHPNQDPSRRSCLPTSTVSWACFCTHSSSVLSLSSILTPSAGVQTRPKMMMGRCYCGESNCRPEPSPCSHKQSLFLTHLGQYGPNPWRLASIYRQNGRV